MTRQSVSKQETGSGYPETEKLLTLCDILDVNLDYLLRDINDTSHEDKEQDLVFLFDAYIGKKCDIKLKQEQPLFGFNKPGEFYSVLIISISDETVMARDMKSNTGQASSKSVERFIGHARNAEQAFLTM